MAKVTFEKGIKCKKCGKMLIPPFKNRLCQSCGTEIIAEYNAKRGWIITDNADIITVKVTHKLLHYLLEEASI